MTSEPGGPPLFEPDPALERQGQGLSPGCQACRRGRWLCIFLTMRCNLQCPTCPAPERQREQPRSAAGETLEQVLTGIDSDGFTGVSFSGGEALLAPARARRWCEAIRGRLPGAYLWLYTNGVLATPQILGELARRGLDEVRFNLDATRYEEPLVWRHLEQACELLPAVAVEVPVDPARLPPLLGALPRLARVGVRYLNLHELIPRSASEMPQQSSFALDHRQQIPRLTGGREALLLVAREARRRSPALIVNRCTHEVKRHQLAHRRLAAVRRTPPQADQQVTASGYQQSLLARFADGRLEQHHPAQLHALQALQPPPELTLLTFHPPMEQGDRRSIVARQPLEPQGDGVKKLKKLRATGRVFGTTGSGETR